ncbi:hypothetical protein LIP_1922 [Limnochorda pilosa]|uniref:acetyl-CoA C-acetyltransferase n=1 Tax=Limnochorda pilosa TaxID=1555112 RepID=A0A0K2SKX4_LIMPI|nr:hypothetical protein LIP_1922 [Limnochorda pilosa]
MVLAAGSILLGENRMVVAGGMESMSQAPYLLTQARYGYRMGHGELLDSMVLDGLTCPMEHVHMGITAENVAAEFHVGREEQDRFAYESHRRAVAAQAEGFFDAEIVPVEVPQRKGPAVVVRQDEDPRPDTSLEALSRLRPAFKPDGTVTAGNASSINDGAGAPWSGRDRPLRAERGLCGPVRRGPEGAGRGDRSGQRPRRRRRPGSSHRRERCPHPGDPAARHGPPASGSGGHFEATGCHATSVGALLVAMALFLPCGLVSAPGRVRRRASS